MEVRIIMHTSCIEHVVVRQKLVDLGWRLGEMGFDRDHAGSAQGTHFDALFFPISIRLATITNRLHSRLQLEYINILEECRALYLTNKLAMMSSYPPVAVQESVITCQSLHTIDRTTASGTFA